MSSENAGRNSTTGIYIACILLCYTQAAGVTTIYSMASMLYRVFNDPLRIGWVITAYYLVAAGSSAICGRFGDLLGRRRIALFMLAVGGCGALISANSPGLNGVIIGCALQGTAGGVMPLAFGILRENLPPLRVPFAIGIMSSAATAGAGISFLIAGLVIDNYSWNGGFYMKAILAVITAASMVAFVPAVPRRGTALQNISIVPGLLFAPAVAGIFIAIQLAHDWGWSDLRVWAIVVGSLLVIAFWAIHQSRQETPLIYVKSLANRKVLLGNLLAAALAVGWCQNGQIMSLYMQQPTWTETGFGVSASISGLILMATLAISLFASPWGGLAAARRGTRYSAFVGSLIGIAAWTGVILNHSTLWFFITADLIFTAGLCITQVTGFNLVVQATAPERTSEASGMSFVIFYTFSAIGGQIIFLLLATSTIANPGAGSGSFPSAAAYNLSFGFIEAMGLVCLFIAWLLPRNSREQNGNEQGLPVTSGS